MATVPHTPAILVLADGSTFVGKALGQSGLSTGEVVFNTSITGYQEILTDPSYAGQIVTLTYPHIGNTGTTPEDDESGKVWAAGLVIRNLPMLASNFRNQQDLDSWLKERNVVAIHDIDTRRLTRLLRDKGAANGCIYAGADVATDLEAAKAKALKAAREFPDWWAWIWHRRSPAKNHTNGKKAAGNSASVIRCQPQANTMSWLTTSA